MFEQVPKAKFPELEEEVLQQWKEEGTFQESLRRREEGPYFSIYDGPPFATGMPHYGHLLAGTIKDVVPRYKTMKGFYAPRRFGWDCHGIPIEHETQKRLHLGGNASIEAFGIAKFNEECRTIVLRYTEEWREVVGRMGRWVDFDHTYHTMDTSFMESVWWAFKQLFERDFVYEGFRVMPFCAALGTPLSNFEAGENYKDVDDPSLTVMLPLVDEPEVSLLVWTTTPWTLVSNLAAMVGPEITYAKVRDHEGRLVILAEERLFAYGKHEIVERMKGLDLIGKKYQPLFDYFSDREAFRVIAGENVSTGDGTGVVHSAPAFGEADFFACQREGIELVCPVDDNGLFTNEVPEYAGQFVKEADKDIVKRIKAKGLLYDQGTIRHRYPFCPRTNTPLIYKAVSTWFVRVEKIRDELLAANEKVHWTPAHLKHGRFGKWLAQARDWNVARSRFWGTPIPIWRADDGEMVCIGSVEELEKLTGEKVDDLHRHHIDQLTFERGGKKFRRISEVLDCWFESGSMPYAQNHYPFENRELVDKIHPADFIAEGLDQTRGWFYTLTVLSTILFGEPAFKNIIVNGIVLAESGVKMSKSLRNYPDPMLVVNKCGADAIRLYLLHSGAVKGDDVRFSEQGVETVMRQVLLPLWNAYTFFVTYANIGKWEPSSQPGLSEIDRWILSRLQTLLRDVESGLEAYDLFAAIDPFVSFIDQLTNWYIRLNRRRFWEEDEAAYWTLYTTLVTLCKVAAPFIPFLSDAIYRLLGQPESVHLADFPVFDASLRDQELEAQMEAVQTVTRLGHGLRKTHKVKVRQPLPAVHIASGDIDLQRQAHLIATELNVKEVLFTSDETQFVQIVAKPNFRILGKKVGKLMRPVQKEIATFDATKLDALQAGKTITITVHGKTIELTSEDVQVERHVKEGLQAANEGAITVILDTQLNEELLLEGMARELVNRVSTMRKEAGLDYTARIELTIEATDHLCAAFDAYADHITGELLATKVTFAPNSGTEWEINGEPCTITLEQIHQSS
jgi:isoleucyl-tRNA synthetase